MNLKARAIMLMFVLPALACTGCASDPQKLAEAEAANDQLIKFYEREARDYRARGNEVMAAYFDGQAQEQERKTQESGDSFWGLVFDLILGPYPASDDDR